MLFGQALANSSINLPIAEPLPRRTKPAPYLVVTDNAFALKTYLPKPYPLQGQPGPNRIYNYRLSRARRIVENVFGIILNRFRILRKPSDLSAEKTTFTVSAICVLHDFLMTRRIDSDASPNSFDKDDQLGEWRNLGMSTSNLFELTRGQAHLRKMYEMNLENILFPQEGKYLGNINIFKSNQLYIYRLSFTHQVTYSTVISTMSSNKHQ